MTDNNTKQNEISADSIFDGGEFVLTKDEDGTVVGGGFKIKSLFLQGGIAPMTTLNDSKQNGGNVSSPFESLAVPAGLFYVNMRVPKKYADRVSEEHYKPHKTISDDMIDELYSLIEFDKKRKRKTRKHNTKLNKHTTRRLK